MTENMKKEGPLLRQFAPESDDAPPGVNWRNEGITALKYYKKL